MVTHTPTIDNIEHEAYGDEWWFGGSRGEGQTIITIDGQLWVTGGNQVETAKVIKQRVNGWDEQQAKIDELVKALGVAKQALAMLGSEIPKLRADVGKDSRIATPANYAAELTAMAKKAIDAALTRAKGE